MIEERHLELIHAELDGELNAEQRAELSRLLLANPEARAFRDQLERVKPTPQVAEWERIANQMRLVAERVVSGQLSVDEAAKELDARANDILEKRRWMLARGEPH